MPYKDLEKKRAYQRGYMRKKRSGIRPSASPEPELVKPHLEQVDPPQFIDRDRSYTVEDRYPYPAYLVQDGFWYDPKTGNLVGKAR